MKKALFIPLLIAASFSIPTSQAAVQEKAQTKKEQQETVILPKSAEHEVAVRLVLVDIIATDRKGNVVSNLAKDDFELFEDGRSQPVNSLDFIRLQAAITGESVDLTGKQKKTFFVIFDSINSIKRILDRNRDRILEKLIGLSRLGHEVMVLELREDKNMEILQTLTAEESLIAAAVSKASGSIWVDKAADALSVPHVLAGDPIGRREDMDGHRSVEQQFKEANRQIYEIQTRKRFEQTISGLLSAMNVIKDLPGRKPVLYISSGFPNISFENVYDQSGGADQGFAKSQVSLAKIKDPFKILGKNKGRMGSDIFKDLIRFANSHNISFYTMDPDNYLRFTLPDIAYDNFPRKISSPFDFTVFQDEITEIKRIELNNLNTLAADTGGTTLQGGDRFDNFEKYITRDLTSHYELSYYPSRAQPDGEYHKIRVRVKRDGVKINAREGYFDYKEDQKEQLMFSSAAANPDMFKEVNFQCAPVPFQTSRDKLRLWINLGLPVQDLILSGDQYKEFTIIKTNLWMNDEKGDRAFSAQVNIPIILSTRFRKRLAQAEYFGYSICSDEMRLKPGSYRLVFAVYDRESGRVGTVEDQLSIPDLKKIEPCIQTALFGQIVKSETAGKDFILSDEDGALQTSSGKFYPMAGSSFGPGDQVYLYLQLFQPEKTSPPSIKLDITQEGFIVGDIPASAEEAFWNKKTGIWHMVFSLRLNRFTSGEYSLRVVGKTPGVESPSIKFIPFRLR